MHDTARAMAASVTVMLARFNATGSFPDTDPAAKVRVECAPEMLGCHKALAVFL